MHTLVIFTAVLSFGLADRVYGVGTVGFYADSNLSYGLKCDNKQSTKNKSGISRDSEVEGLFLNYTEYDHCPVKTAEQCNRNGIKGYK